MGRPRRVPDPSDAPLLTHLLELRSRLLRVVIAMLVLAAPLTAISQWLFEFMATPVISALPEGANMIATGIISPFLTPFKLAMVAALFLVVPYALHQAWQFVAPGLYQHEKRLAAPILISSSVLFFLGVAFGRFVVMPLVVQFSFGMAPDVVSLAPDIAEFFDFMLMMFFIFGVAFEIPVAVVLLIWTGATTAEALKEKRPYIFVGCFVVGMLLTPPDVISQCLLAIPGYLLYEMGILAARFVPAKQDDQTASS